jgi:hypothetical protein
MVHASPAVDVVGAISIDVLIQLANETADKARIGMVDNY